MEELDGVLETINKLREQSKETTKTLNDISVYLLSIQDLEFSTVSSPVRKQFKDLIDVINVKETWKKNEIITVLMETVPPDNKLRQQKFIRVEK